MPEIEFYYPPDVVISTWHVFNEHSILPNAGGWLDQDEALVMHDWGILNQVIAVFAQEKAAQDGEHNR